MRSRKAFYALVSACLSLLGNLALAQQKKEITGRIEDGHTHQPIAGASIQASGTQIGTLADDKGGFTLSIPDSVTHLTVQYVGYSSQEVPLAGQGPTIIVSLVPGDKALDDIVVVGYGTQKKVTVTGAVTAVEGKDLQKAPVTNLSNSLSGRLPGVTAVQASGEPGYDGSSIRIRGTNSLGNSDALIVIDGVPGRAGGLERLNPADIESVSVLKDASAAIYGSRAANGVILITTKQGKSGKPKLSYDFSYGLQRPTRTPEMSDATQYATIRNELKIYDNVPTDEWADAAAGFAKDGAYTIKGSNTVLSADFTPEDFKLYKDGSEPLTHPNTDWFGTTLKDWSPQQRHNLQLSGGSENVHYLASVGYLDQDAYYKNSATGYQQYDLRFNLEANITKNLKVSLGIVAREEYRHFPTVGAGDIFRMLMRGKPTEIEVWPNGLAGPDIEYGQNPYVITTSQTGYDHDKRDYFQTNGKIEYQIPGIEGLKLTAMASVDKMSARRKLWQTPWTLYFWDDKSFEADGTTPVLTGSVRSSFTDPRLKEWAASQLAVNLTGMIDYKHNFGDHELTFLAGVTREKTDNDDFYAFRRYFISSYNDQLGAGGQQEQDLGNDPATENPYGLFQRARLSYFGRVGYNYKEKYIAEFLWRSDGSYIFPPERRFGFFPGVTAGWRISEENFWKNNIHAINDFKIRGSWGQMGAEAYLPGSSTLAEYQYLNTMGYGSYILGGNVDKTLYESKVNNPDFTWEVANNINVGFDAAALNNHLNVTFDYFYNKRTNILITRGGSIPESSGITDKLPPVNLGRVNNKGWEFKVGYNGDAGELHYDVSVNGGYAKNKIVFWDETPGAPVYQQSTGQPVGSFLAYQFDGIFSTQASIDDNKVDYSDITGQLRPGDMRFKDVNGDGKITGDDKVRLDKTNTPSLTTGFNMNLDYKGFDFSLLFQGAFGGLQYIGQTESGDIGNFTKYAYDHRWTIDNPSTTDPRLANRSNTYYTDVAVAGANTYWLKSNNYVRLKNLEIGYTLPEKLLEKAGISRLRVFANGLNLITWDKIKMWDPESTSTNGQYYPQAKIINFGVSVAF